MAKVKMPLLGSLSKAELIKLVQKLQASERKLLNQVAKLEEHKTIITRELHREVTLEEALDRAAEPSALPGIGPCKPYDVAHHENVLDDATDMVPIKPALPWEPK